MLRRIVAPNSSFMTLTGTNTYLIGKSEIALIDPGPNLKSHLHAIRAAIGDARVTKILVTHSHIDHTELTHEIKKLTDATVYAHHKHRSLLSYDERDRRGSGIDPTFVCDKFIDDDDIIQSEEGWEIKVIWTPGHLEDHVCFSFDNGRALLTGDHIMNGSTSVISPPFGNMTDYIASLKKLQGRGERVLYPGHGGPIDDPEAMIEFQLAHRLEREEQILSALRGDTLSPQELVTKIYIDLPPPLKPLAAKTVFAHLIDLTNRGLVKSTTNPHFHAKYFCPLA